ncbi:T9SS type A sorting domain-containing protein [Dyadobacter aurulentus]|uniref:T9SS type A sorting domain-containing protein n=1 Tax=Dyadobacter sp. UC 10 TaxID=2605428 RepID=UPI0011F1B972|nr:T9SS type A sorting domain-containing protein [Dyadobacter sp. UC 10]KAA0993373.1 T9SS type A sorting domain-containing protein [Dyadobacter sp. UC 10]
MKNLYFLIVFILLHAGAVHAQCPPEGSVSIIGQAGVAHYTANYSNCSALTGNLYVNDIDATNLSFLQNIESVGGFVRITDCKNLTSLNGLQKLGSVGGELTLSVHPLLTNLDGLSVLTSVGGDFSLYGLPLVANLDGLNALTSIGGGLSIEMLPLITNLDGLSNLTSVSSFVNVVNNTSLFDCAISILCQIVTDGSIPVNFNGNAPGCAEAEDVTTLCNTPGDGCASEEVTILTDEDIADFTRLYGACTTILGDLIVKNVSDLSFLSNVTVVTGNVRIEECPELISLNGLQRLRSIGGELAMVDLPLLTNVNGLSALTGIGGGFGLVRLPLVANLAGLDSLTRVDGMFSLDNLASLANVDGLNALTTVGGNFWLYDLPNLSSLDGLSALASIGGDFSLYSLQLVANLDGLNALTSIGGGLSVEMLPLITNLDGLSNLTSISSFVNVVYNELLSRCAVSILCQKVTDGSIPVNFNGNAPGCDREQDVLAACNVSSDGCPPGDITIRNDDDIAIYNQLYSSCTSLPGNLTVSNVSNLSFLSHVTAVAGNVRIEDCPDLTSLNGLQGLESVGGGLLLSTLMALPGLSELENLKAVGTEGLTIALLPQLTSLDGLEQLTSLEGQFYLYNLESLSDITAVDKLTTVGGDLSFYALPSLSNLDGLNALTSVGGEVALYALPSLSNLEGLNAVTSIGGNFYMYYLLSLGNLDGLSNLTSVGGGLSIESVPLITNLNGLRNIDLLGDWVTIENNDSLASCAIATICEKFADTNTAFTINNNAAGCSDTDEIQTACAALPVTLVEFEAGETEEGVLLSWRTTMETNSDRFEIQRSHNAKEWSVAGIAASRGESQAIVTYQFIDRQMLYGHLYYRLKMIDLDGSFAYSSIVSVLVDSEKGMVFPNPATEILNIKANDLSQISRITIADLSGRSVYASDTAVSSISLKGFKPGLYLITIRYIGGQIYNDKVVVNR